MAEKVEDSRAQRIRAEAALVRAEASAREGRIAMTTIALAGAGVFGLLTISLVAVIWNKDRDQVSGQHDVVHHHHTTERFIERHTVVYLNEGTKREFYKALSAGEVKYIDR